MTNVEEIQRDIKRYGFENTNKDLDESLPPLHMISSPLATVAKKEPSWESYKARTFIIKDKSVW